MQTRRILASVGTTGAIILGAFLSPATAMAHPAKAKPCVAPRVTGDSLPVARRRLDRAGCRVGRVHRPKVASGSLVVRRQSVRPGRRLRHGARVALWLRVKPTKAVGTTAPTETTTGATPSSKINYSTSVDPTFTQSPSNPLSVIYSYSADATATINGVVTDLAAIGQLPAGILNLYSNGTLECSLNVGGATIGGSCNVAYAATGTYQVTTEYIPNSATAVEQTDTETISPFPTVLTVAATIGPVTGSQFDIGIANEITDSAGTIAGQGSTLSVAITDASTGQNVGNFQTQSDSSCYIVDQANVNGTFFFDGGTCWTGTTGDLNPNDSYTLTLSYAGSSAGYAASVSGAQVI